MSHGEFKPSPLLTQTDPWLNLSLVMALSRVKCDHRANDGGGADIQYVLYVSPSR